MRLLMVEAQVQLAPNGRAPVTVSWTPLVNRRSPRGRLPSPIHVVISVIDHWRYDGRWWEKVELHRNYYLLELDNEIRLELFQEGGNWWAARVSD